MFNNHFFVKFNNKKRNVTAQTRLLKVNSIEGQKLPQLVSKHSSACVRRPLAQTWAKDSFQPQLDNPQAHARLARMDSLLRTIEHKQSKADARDPQD